MYWNIPEMYYLCTENLYFCYKISKFRLNNKSFNEKNKENGI